MVIITNIYFPPQSLNEMKEILLSLPPKPEYITVNGPYFHSEGQKGIHSMTIYEFETSREADAHRFIMANRINPYFDVPGFSFSCDMWMETIEGFQMMGIS